MKKTKQLGIWMDHSLAYLMEFTTKPFEIQTIIHEFHLEDKATSKLEKNTSIKNVYRYYNGIAEAIINYDKIILLVPQIQRLTFLTS